MIVENGVLLRVEAKDLSKDGWFIVKGHIKEVGEFAFENVKDKLTKVVFEPGCEVIKTYAFRGCKNLSGVLLPNTLTIIEALAFNETGLVRVDIPKSVKEIYNSAFMRCFALKTVHFHANVDGWKAHLDNKFDGTLLYDEVFYYCRNIEKITFHQKPYALDLSSLDKAQVVVKDDELAKEFWMKQLKANPMSYKHMDEIRATEKQYETFRQACRKTIEKSYQNRMHIDNVKVFVDSAMTIEKYSSTKREK